MIGAVVGCLLFLTADAETPIANQLLAGYDNYENYTARVNELAKRESVAIKSLGKSLEDRELWLLTVGEGDVDGKPAMLIIGNTDATHLIGSAAAVGLADVLSADTDQAKQWRQQATFYILPRPNPDGTETLFAKPLHARDGNTRPTDDDEDFRVDEDGPEDLNGDGLITQMRVADAGGKWVPHPQEPRLLVGADPTKGEKGQYSLYTEGRDTDGDERQSEDGVGGVSLRRNFTFAYPAFGDKAGPHAVSEPESRALADFAFDQPNIALVLTFSPVDNLLHPWKPNSNSDKARIKTAVHTDDAPHLQRFAERFQKVVPNKSAPDSANSDGSVVAWAYFHYGRWSLGSPAWWIPPTDKSSEEKIGEKSDPEKGDDTPSDNKSDADESAKKEKSDDDKKDESDKRAEAERRALAWFEKVGRAGFVEWQKVEHPDFPNQAVEVGGFVPLARTLPPASEIPKIVERHTELVKLWLEQRPTLEIVAAHYTAMGGGIYQLEMTIRNTGALPTLSTMGRQTKWTNPLQVELDLAGDVTFLDGSRRGSINPIGGGESAQRSWVILIAPDAQGNAELSGKVRVAAPAVGAVQADFTPKP